MRSRRNEEPRLSAIEGRDLPLSGAALLDLMEAVLARGAAFRFRARGWSMAPFIRDGDVITIAPLGSQSPGLGEVVAFVRPGEGRLVVHRVVARPRGAPFIQGDNCADDTVPDGIIPAENLLGRVTRVERNGRAVWLGLGPERLLIACLSRRRLLVPVGARVTALLKPLRRRTV